MTDNDKLRKQLERALGLGPLGGPRKVPGVTPDPDREVRYVSFAPQTALDDLFHRVLDAAGPEPSHGGASARNCTLRLPNGESYFALSYSGDVERWREKVEEGAKVLGLKVARFEDGELLIDDGRRIALAELAVRFY